MLPEDEPVPTPEEYIGRTIESDGVARRVDSIQAIGSKFVVFKLRNPESGEIDRVLKVLRVEFDPALPLMNALPEALGELDQDPDRVLRICDRWLELDPSQESAAFNKGVAHLTKNEVALALKAFELAVSLAPGDLWNLIHRAACLARLGRDRECLGELMEASRQGGRRLRGCLVQIPEHGLAIRESLERMARAEPSNREVRRVLRKHLGLSLLVHLGLHRLRSKVFHRSPRKVPDESPESSRALDREDRWLPSQAHPDRG